MYRSLPLALLVAVAFSGCEVHLGPLKGAAKADDAASPTSDAPAGEVWIYTSIYQSVIEQIDVVLEEKHPGIKVEWYRAGSEKVATRLGTELKAGGTEADLVLTSDPFWYLKLKNEGRLLPHMTLDVLPLPREYVDPDGAYSTCRISTMVIAYHPAAIAKADLPATFKELAEPAWAGKVTLGDPLASGTHFTTTAFLSTRYGWKLYEGLRRNGAVSSGGNSSVLRRIESQEFSLGIVLLENVLAAREKGSPVEYLVPGDGAISIPGNIAILSSTNNPTAARAVYDVIMSVAGQEAMVVGWMHSANPRIAAPPGAPAFTTILEGGFRWSEPFTADVQRRSAEIKARFSKIMNE